MKKISDKLKKLFGFDKTFSDIQIKKAVIEKLCELSKDSHPKEFLAFFEGFIGNNIIIEDIIFQPYIANQRSAMPRLDIPLTTNILGSAHSHPGSSNKPSGADKQFFKKTGIVHAIIKYPYRQEDIQFYDLNGQAIVINIV